MKDEKEKGTRENSCAVYGDKAYIGRILFGMNQELAYTIYVSQIIVPCTLNLYSAICQLFFKKTKRRKEELTFSFWVYEV